MKKINIFTVAFVLCVQLTFAQSKWANRVLEFLPAPGQFTNEKTYPAYVAGDDAVSMASKATTILNSNSASGTANNMSTISLGAYGGYIIVGFDHPILNKPYAYDFKVHGNWFDGNAESGIVMVSKDVNNNGIADDAWFEIAGSEYYSPGTIHQYEIRYEKPSPLNGNVKWTDNQGGSGYVLRNIYHMQESYYPLWFDGEKLIFKGTKLQSNAWNSALPPQQYWRSETFAWGYADNQANAGELSNFDIDWAVDIKGNKVKLDRIDFVKVYTGLIQDAGWLGETSTEFSQAEDLHTEYAFPPVYKSDVHIVKNLPALPSNTFWQGTDATSFTNDTVTFKSVFTTSLLKDGFTYTNQTSGLYASASGKGIHENNGAYITGVIDAATSATTNRTVTFNDGLPHGLEGVYVNNTAATVSFLRSLMIKGDYVKLVATGLDATGNPTGTKAEFRLADYSQTNSVMNYIVSDWCWMDLTPLGSVSAVAFSFEANKTTIIPSSFCLDRLVMDILSISLQPIGNPGGVPKICSDNAPYKLSTLGVGTGLTYQWYKNNSAIAGATSPDLDFASTQVSINGTYYCIISNGVNQARTKEVPVVIYQTSQFTQNLTQTNVNVLKTDIITASVKAIGENLAYQWYKGTTLISPVTNTTSRSMDFIPAPYGFLTEHNGVYSCRVTGSCGTITSNSTTYTAITNPNLAALEITKQPKDTTVCYGTTVSLDVAANSATSYTWQYISFTGAYTSIPNSFSTGFANPKIDVYNRIADMDYRCMIKQDATILYTDTVKVHVIQKLSFIKPGIIAHQGGYTAIQYVPLQMEVSALDFTPTSYQWYYKGASDPNFIKLNNETTPTYYLPYVLPADAGRYKCEVAGAAGTSVIEYTLTVTSSIARAPVLYSYTNTAVNGANGVRRPTGFFTPGEKGYFNTQVQTTGGFTYKWYKDGQEVIIPEGNKFKGADDEISEDGYWTKNNTEWYLYIKNIQEIHAGEYILETTDPNGVKERSAPLRIIVNPLKPEITNILTNIIVNENEVVSLKVEADGKGFVPTYQWYLNGAAIMGGTKSPYVTDGPDKAEFAFLAKNTMAGIYYCIITTPGGSDTSNVVTLTVNPAVRILKHPSDQIILNGNEAMFTILAEGRDLSYQWMKDGVDIEGAINDTLTISVAAISDEGEYTCLVSSTSLGDAESGIAGLSVINKPVISGNVICNDESSTILKVASEIKPVQVRYQWYKDGGMIPGATYNWINIKNAQTDVSSYYCTVSNGNGESDPIVLVKASPVITSDLEHERTVTENSPFELNIESSGQALTYQWFKNEIALTEEENTLRLSANYTDEGVYYCSITNACGFVKSTETKVSVTLLAPEITSQSNSLIVNEGQHVTFEVTATGTNLTYQWYKNGELIENETAATYEISDAAIGDEGDYSCEVKNTSAIVKSDPITLSVLLATSVNNGTKWNAGVTIYPNPADNYITIKATQGDNIEIIDILGNALSTFKMSNDQQTLPLDTFKEGFYVIRISNDTGSKSIGFIKRK